MRVTSLARHSKLCRTYSLSQLGPRSREQINIRDICRTKVISRELS